MTLESRLALFLRYELVSALRVTTLTPLSVGCVAVQDLGKPAVEELLLDWHAPFLTEEEKDRLIAWHLVVSLQSIWWIWNSEIEPVNPPMVKLPRCQCVDG